ncbi:MAG: hypothetical protein AB2697_04375 [Candidatus Thiodiazotropha endolucinida]
MNNREDQDVSIREKIKAQYPDLSDEECEEIEDTLRRYHAVALRVYERRKQEELEQSSGVALTDLGPEDRMK